MMTDVKDKEIDRLRDELQRLRHEYATFVLDCWDKIPENEPEPLDVEVNRLLNDFKTLIARVGVCDACGVRAPLTIIEGTRTTKDGELITDVCLWGCDLEANEGKK